MSEFCRPNCFQIILRALNNQVSAYYICADNSDQVQVGNIHCNFHGVEGSFSGSSKSNSMR